MLKYLNVYTSRVHFIKHFELNSQQTGIIIQGCEIGGCFTLPYMECSEIEDSPGVEMTTTTTPATESEGPPTLIDVTQAVESCTPGGACSEAGSSCSPPLACFFAGAFSKSFLA